MLIAEILGHKSLNTSKIYTHLKKEKTKKLYEQFAKPQIQIEGPSELLA